MEVPDRFYRSGERKNSRLTKSCTLIKPPGMIKRLGSFSFTKKKTNQKKSPVRRGLSGCPVLLESGGRCGTRPPTADSVSHSAYSPASAMLGASPRGKSNPLRWSAPLRGLPKASRYAAGESLLFCPGMIPIVPWHALSTRYFYLAPQS